MTKLVILGAACLAASVLSGCAQIESGFNSAANFIDQPNVQQAVATIKTVSTALVCDVAAGSSLAKSIEAQAGAHQGVTNLIDVSSTAVCAALQGKVVAGVTEANVPAVTAVSQ
jgi:predicted nicotinamide N-methyase